MYLWLLLKVMLYTSDIDSVYASIHDKSITPDMVKIVSSNQHHTLKVLEDFKNIEEVLCPILFPLSLIDAVGTTIISRPKLKIVSFLTYIPIYDQSHEFPPIKRPRIKQLTPYRKLVGFRIPDIIRKIGLRMRYMSIFFNIIDLGNDTFTTILLDNGFLKITSDAPIYKGTGNILNSLILTGSLRGISTNGDIGYYLNDIKYIPEVTIIARTETKDNPINATYLRDLVSKSEIVNIIYNADSIHERFTYSDILKKGTSGSLKYIRGIVPILDVEDHIRCNKLLEEIHVLVRDTTDVNHLTNIMGKYNHRCISYYVHYHKTNDNEYWKCLKSKGDVILENMIVTLMIDR